VNLIPYSYSLFTELCKKSCENKVILTTSIVFFIANSLQLVCDITDVPLPPGMAPLPDEIEDAGTFLTSQSLCCKTKLKNKLFTFQRSELRMKCALKAVVFIVRNFLVFTNSNQFYILILCF
jgi:hypothetical protein